MENEKYGYADNSCCALRRGHRGDFTQGVSDSTIWFPRREDPVILVQTLSFQLPIEDRLAHGGHACITLSA